MFFRNIKTYQVIIKILIKLLNSLYLYLIYIAKFKNLIMFISIFYFIVDYLIFIYIYYYFRGEKGRKPTSYSSDILLGRCTEKGRTGVLPDQSEAAPDYVFVVEQI